ncbi:MAG: hypothetical protein V3V75_11285, partial [Thermoguttaceae bacterium]
FRDRVADDALLSQLAATEPKGGSPGLVIEAPDGPMNDSPATIEELLKKNTFRHDLPEATSSREAWHYLLLVGACLFFVDVFYRRVHVSFAWVRPLGLRAYEFAFRRGERPVDVEVMDRLRSRKAEVDGQIDQMRRQTRFEAPEESTAQLEPEETPKKPTEPSIAAEATGEEESYTERLLRAKKKAWDKRKKE